MFEAAQASHCADSGPCVPSSIETHPAAMFGRIDGIENGLQRSGPLFSRSRWQFWKLQRPPIPVPSAAPTRSGSAETSMPASRSAIREAAIAICAKRSIRRALFASIHSVGSKPRTSQAKETM